jgi:putative transcriptional regulator
MDSLEGLLLVASPRLPDPNFYRSVVLIIQHDKQGAFGLILNRPTENTIEEIWEMIGEQSCDNDQPINLGGPVGGPLLALHDNSECSEREILPGVHFATHKDHLNHLVADSMSTLRIYTGYSGWGAGQLEGEMKMGGWMTLPASADYVFGDAEGMWKRAAQAIGEDVTGPLVTRAGAPSDPGFN